MDLNSLLNRFINVYNFKPETSIPDLNGKIIVVTGGNAGLGLASIIHLIQHNPDKIYLTARSQAKFDTALAEIRKHAAAAEKTLRFVEMDLSSLASVKAAADRIAHDTNRIDILINNAGIMGVAPVLTADGYEIHFGTNHMGHALFTKRLMPTLLKTADTSDVRIVNVSSGAYMLTKTAFDENLVKTDMADEARGFDNVMPRYAPSKLANILHAKGLAKNYPSITSVSICPGRVKTGLLDSMYQSGHSKGYGYFQKFYDSVVGAKGVDVGAYTQVWAATEPNKERLNNGGIYTPIGVEAAGNRFSNDDELVEKLWYFTETELERLGY